MVKVSVIIPVYNAEKYLEECLISVINQTLKDIEIICIDDGSTDKSADILKKFQQQDKRLKIITQKNQGPSVARNKALKKAKGEYIGFVDADDYIDLNFYEKLYHTAQIQNADIACCNIVYIKKNKAKHILKYRREAIATNVSDFFKLLGMPKFNYVYNRIYRRQLILDNQIFFKKHFYYEDVIWSTQIVTKCSKAVCVPGIAYYYRYNENSIVNTTKSDHKKQQNMSEAFTFQNNYILEHHLKVEFHYNEISKIKILGLHLFDIKELTGYCKNYYFLGFKIASVKILKPF